MENIITLNEFLDTIQIPITIDGSDFTLSGHTVVGLLTIVLASYFRYLAVSGWGSWETANKQIDPSFQHSPAPILTTRQGCLGLLTTVLTRPLYAFSLFLGLDQLFMAGGFSITFLELFVA